MIRKILPVLLLFPVFSFAQYKQEVPWVKSLPVKKGENTNKNAQGTSSLWELRQSFDGYWESSGKNPKEKGSGHKPFKRWENYWKYFVDTSGAFPSTKELWESYSLKQKGVGNAHAISNFSPIGPERPGTLAGFLPGTGRINTVKVDPTNPDIWYAGAPAGGIWKTTDAGNNWVNLFDDFPQIGVSGIAIDPNDPNIIYIATGDDDAADSFSVGVFKSLDGGQTWNETDLNPDNSNIGLLMNEIFIDPNNSDRIFVGSTQGLFRTLDAGENWEMVLAGNINDFRLKIDDSDTIFAVTTSEYYRSIDGGDTFSRITDILPETAGRTILEVTEANPEVLYILMAKDFDNGGGFIGLYKSIDGGQSFTASTNTVNIFEVNQTFFNMAMEVSPFDEDVIFTGALNIWKSLDGGDTFTKVNNWSVNDERYTHADIHILRYFGNTLFAGTDGGLYISEDNGDTFSDKTGNMQITQFYRIDIQDDNAERVVGGSQDNSGLVRNNGAWNVYTGADGMDYEIDPNNPDLIYGFSQYGEILFVTTDTGETINLLFAPSDNSGTRIQGNWITPLAIGDDGQVYAGYNAVYRLTADGWAQLSPSFVDNIEDLEVAPNHPDILYVAEANKLYRSEDGGISFIEVASLDSFISSFAINHQDPNTLYIAASNRVGVPQVAQPFGRGVYKVTVDPATNTSEIENITYNIPADQAFFSIAHQDMHANNPIYVGTHLGIYRLDDTLTEWEEYFTNLPTVAVGDLEIDPINGILVASTYGRGAWQSPIPLELPENDIELAGISPTSGQVLCTSATPEIAVRNAGDTTINEVVVSYTVNGGMASTFTWEGTIASAESTTISLPMITSTTTEVFDVSITVAIDDDTYENNNSLETTFILNDTGIEGAVDSFEGGSSFLFPYDLAILTDEILIDQDPLWEQGLPNGALLNSTSSGNQAFATDLSGNYSDQTKSVLLSPCYDLASIANPVLKFSMAYDLEPDSDIVFMEYSLDQGITWSVLGAIDSQPNWYNNGSPSDIDGCQNCVGAQWTGRNLDMTEYAYDFSLNAGMGEADLTNESQIVFRMVFESDFMANAEGVVVDDFVIEGLQTDDDDNDGVSNETDNCPLMANADQIDTDGDGYGDVCDLDDDGDGILDVDDNCPLNPNSDQADDDNDGVGNPCDLDSDNDGVLDENDLCSDTPENTQVDFDGCPVFDLPIDNFSVLTIGESCRETNNGMVRITALESHDYIGVLSSESMAFSSTQQFTQETTFTNLPSGDYTLCISIAGNEAFERCFGIVIVEPAPLSVSSNVNTLSNEITLTLEGGTNYTITFNDEVINTTAETITLSASKVRNTINVRTSKDCQGVYEETIILNPDTLIFPNPIVNGDISIQLDPSLQNNQNILVSLHSVLGSEVYRKRITAADGNISFSMDHFPAGIYILNLKTADSLTSYHIVKR